MRVCVSANVNTGAGTRKLAYKLSAEKPLKEPKRPGEVAIYGALNHKCLATCNMGDIWKGADHDHHEYDEEDDDDGGDDDEAQAALARMLLTS